MIYFVQRIPLGLEIGIYHCFGCHPCFISTGPPSLVSSVNLTSASLTPSAQSKVSITIPASFVTSCTFHTSLFCLQHITLTSSCKTAINNNSLVIHYLFLKNIKRKPHALRELMGSNRLRKDLDQCVRVLYLDPEEESLWLLSGTW